jgi:hypothetical protein
MNIILFNNQVYFLLFTCQCRMDDLVIMIFLTLSSNQILLSMNTTDKVFKKSIHNVMKLMMFGNK